jgi:hypothetical protein
MKLDVEYTDYQPTAWYTPNWCKGILVFNTTHRKEVYCHRIGYGSPRRKNAVGIFHVNYK